MDELFPAIENWFDFLSVHREMLLDKQRIRLYNHAIKKSVRRGDIVVDVGTGTGILAFLSVAAGAKKVFAIERRPIIKLAAEIAKRNRLDRKIVFIEGDSKDIVLPQRADLIVSEVIGHFALDENMLDSIRDAKSRFLKTNGTIIPQKVSLHLAPVECPKSYEDISFWSDPVQEIDYGAAREVACSNVYVVLIGSKQLLSLPEAVVGIDISANRSVNVDCDTKFVCTRNGLLHGFAGWFKAQLIDGVEISSSPYDPPTHWDCTFFPLLNPVKVKRGTSLSVHFSSQSRGNGVLWSWSGSILASPHGTKNRKDIKFKNSSKYLEMLSQDGIRRSVRAEHFGNRRHNS